MKREEEICFQQPSERERSVSTEDEPGSGSSAWEGKTQASPEPWSCALPPSAPIPLRFSFFPSHSEPHHRSHYPSTTPTRAGAVGTGAYPRPRGAATMAEPEQAGSSARGRRPTPVSAASPPPPGPRPHPAGPSSVLLTRSSDPPPGSSRSP